MGTFFFKIYSRMSFKKTAKFFFPDLRFSVKWGESELIGIETHQI